MRQLNVNLKDAHVELVEIRLVLERIAWAIEAVAATREER
jgi:hypothetical protein